MVSEMDRLRLDVVVTIAPAQQWVVQLDGSQTSGIGQAVIVGIVHAELK